MGQKMGGGVTQGRKGCGIGGQGTHMCLSSGRFDNGFKMSVTCSRVKERVVG